MSSPLCDEPIRFRNHYHCLDCHEEWSDDWSCCCDDECPSCGKAYTPLFSEDLDEDGDVINPNPEGSSSCPTASIIAAQSVAAKTTST